MQIFSTLGRRDLRKLSAACLLRRYRTGDSILDEGSTGLGMFLITAGRVEVFKTHDGRKIELAVLGKGDILGEMALLDDQPRSASAVAREDTECLLLSRDRFRTLLKRRPSIAWPIVPPLARRVRDLQEQLLDAENTPSAPPAQPPALPHPVDIVDADSTLIRREEPAQDLERVESPLEETDSRTDVLRAPYALMITGAVGFGESARMCEIFFRTLDESSGLADGRPMGEVIRGLPMSLATASMSSWQRGRKLPSRLFATFRDQLRSDWHGEDED